MSDALRHLTLAVQVVEVLYEHANVSIYLCEDPTTSERVVVKQVWPSEVKTPTLSVVHSDLHRELIAAQRLMQASASRLAPHPNVVRYLHTQSSVSGSPAYLTMEYCANDDLFSLLDHQPGGYFPEQQALTLFQQIVSGVDYLHSLGVAHRDISLENILLDAQGHAKICDFGLSVSTTRMCCDQVGKLQSTAPDVVSGQVYDPVAADV